MYILIVNEDPLGRALAAELVHRGHEVAYLDDDPEYCNMVATELGCLTIQGETTNIRILQEAGIERADVLVALLEKDIKNIMVGLFGRQFGVPRIFARLRQQHYRAAYELAGIGDIFSAFDHLLNEFLTAIEQPTVRHVTSLGDGDVLIAGIVIDERSAFVGKHISELWQLRDFPKGALVLGVLERKTQVFHRPSDPENLASYDEVVVAGTQEDVEQIAALLNGSRRRFFKR